MMSLSQAHERWSREFFGEHFLLIIMQLSEEFHERRQRAGFDKEKILILQLVAHYRDQFIVNGSALRPLLRFAFDLRRRSLAEIAELLEEGGMVR